MGSRARPGVEVDGGATSQRKRGHDLRVLPVFPRPDVLVGARIRPEVLLGHAVEGE
jgi:hypothetical protein